MDKKLIRNEQEYREYVFSLLNVDKININEGFDEEKIDLGYSICCKLQDEDYKPTDDEWKAVHYYIDLRHDDEYRKRCEFVDKMDGIDLNYVEDAFGVKIQHDCWDTDENGNDIDEDGNILPDDSSSPDKLVFEDWVNDLIYPLVVVSWIEAVYDRVGKSTICAVEFVEMEDFEL